MRSTRLVVPGLMVSSRMEASCRRARPAPAMPPRAILAQGAAEEVRRAHVRQFGGAKVEMLAARPGKSVIDAVIAMQRHPGIVFKTRDHLLLRRLGHKAVFRRDVQHQRAPYVARLAYEG